MIRSDTNKKHPKFSVIAGYGYELFPSARKRRSSGRENGEVLYDRVYLNQAYMRVNLETKKHKHWQIAFLADHRIAKGDAGTYALGGSSSYSGHFDTYYVQATIIRAYKIANSDYFYFAPGFTYGQLFSLKGEARKDGFSMLSGDTTSSMPISYAVSPIALGLYSEIGAYVPITKHIQIHLAHAIQIKTSQGFRSGPNSTANFFIGLRLK